MFALAIHGGAGPLPQPAADGSREQAVREALGAALAAGERLLAANGSALDAVETAVQVLEDDPSFNAGRGAVLTRDGTVELDAAIMDGATLRAGAVAQLQHVRNPIRLARAILEQLPHVFLVGEGAERFAAQLGLPCVPNEYFITEQRREQLGSLGTVGAVARDRHGHLAAATSTGGTSGKFSGRVGDSPVIGAGTYADDATCAVSATGHGEWLLRTVIAYDISARRRYAGQSLRAAVEQAVSERLTALGAQGGVIAVDARGELVMRYNTPMMLRACVREGEPAYVAIR